MNEAASTALQVIAKEKTKQDIEDTRQATERTRLATREVAKAALALPAFLVMYLIPAIAWPVVLVAAIIAAPQSVIAIMDRMKDLRTEKRKAKTGLPQLPMPAAPDEPDPDK